MMAPLGCFGGRHVSVSVSMVLTSHLTLRGGPAGVPALVCALTMLLLGHSCPCAPAPYAKVST